MLETIFRLTLFAFTLTFLSIGDSIHSQQQEKFPRENVVQYPAIGKGLCVSNLFQTNMVLQRNKPVSIWGWAQPGEKVTVRFSGITKETIASKDRSWRVTFPSLQANTKPQQMSVKGSKATLILENILIGDVWVLGGQSNMEFPLERIENGQLEIVSANYQKIRILTVPAANGPENRPGIERLHEWSGWFGRHFRKGDWDVCSPKIARELSAIGYVFARRIHTASRIPIGIIDASRGGTTVETWTPDPVLRKIETAQVKTLLTEWDQKVSQWDSQQDLKNRIQAYHQKIERLKKAGKPVPPNEKEPSDLRPGPSMDQNRPGNCYASMIAPLAGLQIKGAIFHQGYNNCFNGTEGAILYRQVFPKMIQSWRLAFQDPQLPFGILSLCTEGAVQTMENYCEMMANPGPYIREAQYQTFLNLYRNGDQNIGFTSTYDLRRRWYHPQLKIPAGERIARWALATEYGFEKEVRWKPPMVKEMKVEKGLITLQLDDAVSPVDDGSPIVGFAIAGTDRKFHPANADYLVTGKDNRGREKKDQRILVLTSPMVSNPVHYRYAWGRSPLGNLQAARGTDIPFATQRSDDWPLEQTPLGAIDESINNPNRGQRRKILEALRKQDLERKIQQAKSLLEDNASDR